MTFRILLASNAVFERQALRAVFQSAGDWNVTATCSTGREVMDQLSTQPDIIVTDFSLGDMNCCALLRDLRKKEASLPVVVYADNSVADWQVQATRAGANACVPRTDAQGNKLERAERELLSKVRLCLLETRQISQPPVLRSAAAARPKPKARVELIVIGTSTGGPTALPHVLSKLPASFSVPVVIVQHMPNELFTESLTKSLGAICRLNVHHAKHGDLVNTPGVWVAPGNRHLLLARSGRGLRVELNDGPTLHGVRPAVEHLFQSAAEVRGAGVLAVMLTGMGRDGLSGAEAIVRAGGSLIAQDEASSVVWGMPGAVVDAGLASCVMALNNIGAEIVSRVNAQTRIPA